MPSPRDFDFRQASGTYGFTPAEPIMCSDILGELRFIRSLRCSNGHKLRGERSGSVTGACPDPEGHLGFPLYNGQCAVDIYELTCEGGEYQCSLYFDMYHTNLSEQPAPRGLICTMEGSELSLTGRDGVSTDYNVEKQFTFEGKDYVLLVNQSTNTHSIHQIADDAAGKSFYKVVDQDEMRRIVTYLRSPAPATAS